jgi:flavin-dependent dehydrogenase
VIAGNAPAFDVVILGAGPAGCATGLAVAQRGVTRSLIVAPRHPEGFRIGESLPPDTARLLGELGVFDDFLEERHEASLGSCSSWGSDALHYNDFLFNPFGSGWHLDRRRFDDFLARKAVERGLQMRLGTRLERVERAAPGFRLWLSNGDNTQGAVEARFVVDATGMRSSFARKVGARRLVLDRLLCIVGFLELADASSRLTTLEAVDYGWWYAARIPDGRVAIAVASDPEIIKERGLNLIEGWVAHLRRTNHIAAEFASPRLVGRLLASAAPSARLDLVAGEGWLAVGDAASVFDPISSQGIFKALADGIEAAGAITAALDGSTAPLGAYQSMVADRFDAYWRTRDEFYRMERRWPGAPFWRKRCELGARNAIRAFADA